MRRYSKLFGLRVWTIVRRPLLIIWVIFVVVPGTIYQTLQLVAAEQAQGAVSMFDALSLWDAFIEWLSWWGFVLLAILTLLAVLFRASYELWREEKQAHKKLQDETKALAEELKEVRTSTGRATTRQLQRENKSIKEDYERLRAEIPKPNDKVLIERCHHWSDELLAFLENRAKNEPQAGIFSGERASYNNETIAQYNVQFARPVGSLLNDLAVRGWVTSQERKQFENPIMPLTIQHIANRLAAIAGKSAPE